jgi:hypothetical protein
VSLPDPRTVWADTTAKGYDLEWFIDSEWQVVPPEQPRVCRRPKCDALSVAKLLRGSATKAWWHYCADHLYGRQIHDGHVWAVRVVPSPSEDTGTTPGDNHD